MNIKNIKISQFIILLIAINLISILYKFYLTEKSELNPICVAEYEVIIPKYNKHLDEIIRGNFSNHILRNVALPKKNYSIVNSNIYQLWNIKETSFNAPDCSKLKSYITRHLSVVDKKILSDLNSFKDTITSINTDSVTLKLGTIIGGKSSFIIIPDKKKIRVKKINDKFEIWFDFFSELIFFNIVYIFLVFVFLAIRKKFFSRMFK
jgi:hypothetical protein